MMTVSNIQRLEEGAFQFPSPSQSVSHYVPSDSEMPTQHGKTAGNSAHGEPDVSPGISVLVSLGRPNAIIWVIMAVRVFSLNRHSFRPFTHVFEKFLKGILPAFTNSDSSATVVTVRVASWVKASRFKAFPNCIGWSIGTAVCSFAASLLASTGFCRTRNQVGGSDDFFTSAIANAKTLGASFFNGVIRDDDKFGKPNPDQGLSFWHGIIKLMFCNRRRLGCNPSSAENFSVALAGLATVFKQVKIISA
jgi:hypothetical protein